MPTPRKKKTDDNLAEKLIETMDAFQSHLSNNTPAEETANSTFMKTTTLLLSSLSPINQVRARGDIMKYLCDLQMEELLNK